MRTNYDDLAEQLRGRLSRLTRRGQAIGQDLRAARDSDWTEQANELFNDEVLEGLDGLTRSEAQRLRDALSRIEQGRYGRCGRCGHAIDPARLHAEPEATECRQCAAV